MTSAIEKLELKLAASKQYGNVAYADPKNSKYPINSAARVRAAWAYICMPRNAAEYPLNGVTLQEVKNNILSAAKKFGVEIAADDSKGKDTDNDGN